MAMFIKNEERFNRIFAGWNSKEINLAWQMILFLRKVGVTLEEFEEYAEYRQDFTKTSSRFARAVLILRAKFYEENLEKCPDCGGTMEISPVNVSKCNQIDDKRIKSVWTCRDEKWCGHQIWNKKPMSFYVEKLDKQFAKDYERFDRRKILENFPSDEELLEIIKTKGGCKKENKDGS